MRISVITPTLNSARTLAETLASVSAQTHPDREHLIVDGMSNDRTPALMAAYAARVPEAIVIAERDRGLYDAMNKGIARATGEVIAILNSDDRFEHERVLADVAAHFAATDDDACYGDLLIVRRDAPHRVVRHWRPGPFSPDRFGRGWCPPHPTLFVRRRAYEALGGFRLDLPIAADYEFMLRLLHRSDRAIGYLPGVLVRMRNRGRSGRSLGQRVRGWRDVRQSWRLHGITPPPFLIVRRVLGKVGQFRKFQE